MLRSELVKDCKGEKAETYTPKLEMNSDKDEPGDWYVNTPEVCLRTDSPIKNWGPLHIRPEAKYEWGWRKNRRWICPRVRALYAVKCKSMLQVGLYICRAPNTTQNLQDSSPLLCVCEKAFGFTEVYLQQKWSLLCYVVFDWQHTPQCNWYHSSSMWYD